MKKRILSVALALALCLTLLPITALAAGDKQTPSEVYVWGFGDQDDDPALTYGTVPTGYNGVFQSGYIVVGFAGVNGSLELWYDGPEGKRAVRNTPTTPSADSYSGSFYEFSWDEVLTTTPPVGEGYQLKYNFTPDDQENYTNIENGTLGWWSFSVVPKSIAPTITLSQDSFLYDGTEKRPGVTVKYGDITFTEGTDYTVTYENNTGPGTATVKITDVAGGNYTINGSKTFTINQQDPGIGQVSYNGGTLKDTTAPSQVTLTRSNTDIPGTLVLTDAALSGDVSVYNWKFTPESTLYKTVKGTINLPVEHDLSYSNGEGAILERCAGCNHSGSAALTANAEYVYSGSAQEKFTVSYNNWKGSKNLTPAYDGQDTVNVGTVTGILSYRGASATKSYQIVEATMTASAEGYTGTYDSQYHGITVTVSEPANATVTYRKDENSSYSPGNLQYKNAGTYTVYYKIEADNYEPVESSKQVVITSKAVTVSGITAADKVYDSTTDVELDCTNASISGKAGSDYLGVLSAEGSFADKDAGQQTVNITGVTLDGADKGNYQVTSIAPATATISPRFLSEVTLTLTPNTFEFAEDVKEPAVTAKYGGETLGLNTDYTIDSSSVTEATAVSTGNGYPITINAVENGNYTGSQTAYWTITKGTMTGITADDVEETYDGSEYGITVEGVPGNAAVYYGESADDCTLTESPKYTDADEYTVYYKVVKDGYHDFTDSATVKINKAGQDAPAAPAVKMQAVTSSVVELVPVTVPGQGAVQYACSTADTAPTDNVDWQSSHVFEDLSKDTQYYFFARYAGNENYLPSPASAPAASVKTLDTYTITYDLNTGSGTAPENQTQDVGTSFAAAAQTGFQKTGYVFLGWATDADAAAAEYAAGTSVSDIDADDTLYAVWQIDQFTISFVTNGGTAVAEIEQDYATALTQPTTTRAGYGFGGWYEDAALTTSFVFTESTTMPGRDITLYAKWNPLDGIVYTVNHHFEKVVSGYDTQSEQLSGVTDTDTNAQAKAVTGFSARSFSQSKIAGDGTTVVDIYYVRNLHILTFKPENGEAPVFSTVAYGAPVNAPADPQRPGYTFNGWGDVAAVMPDSSLTYTAEWTANTYTVTLVTNKGTIKEGDVTEYTCGEGTALPVKVTRAGYDFAGWYDNKELKGEPVSEITASEYGDQTYYAKWSRKTVEVPAYPSEYDIGEGGGILVTDKTPVRGQIVTIKPDPDKGYEVDEVIVTDKDGDEVEVIENDDGTYSFRQPAGKVTISVTFVDTECDGGRRCPAYAYTDVDITQWYHQAVDYVLENGLMNGTSVTEKQFSPYEMTSRAMIVTILWRLEGEPVVNHLMQFGDVPQDTWYSEAVRWAASEGIVTGYNGFFNPMDPITREQFAAILYRYEQSVNKKLPGYEPSNVLALVFKDGFEISEYANPAMQWAYHEGVVGGVGNGYLAPKSQMSRVEAAQMLMNYLEK